MANGLLGGMEGLRGILASPSTNDFALALLANSGYSNRRRGLGEIIGTSMMQSRAMAAEAAQQKLREQYMQAQIAAMQQKQEPRSEELEMVLGEDGRPVFVPRSQAVGKSPFIQERGTASTPATLQEYALAQSQGYDRSFMDYQRDMANMTRALPAAPAPTESPAAVREYEFFIGLPEDKQKRYLALKRAQQVENIGGVPTIVGAAGDTTPLSTPDAEAEARRKAAAATAQGTADVDGAGKRGAARSMDYVIQQFRAQIPRTPQGGPMGALGMIGSVTQSQEARRFNNLREQLSTELRTVFRIPGEGTLSDREQAQYGVQLPDVKNSAGTNEAILQDVQARVAARLGQPQATAPAPKQRVRVDANGNVIR